MNGFGLVALILLVSGSVGLAVWIASRLTRATFAFVAAWALTPALLFVGTLLVMPLFRAAGSPTNDGTWIIMVPIYGMVLGLLSAIITVVVVSVRRNRLSNREPSE